MSSMSPTPVAPTPHENDAAWALALQRVLAEPQRIRVHYQPIVDLRRGVVRGYEALARFPEAPEVPPRAWFDAAARLGYAGAFEAQVVQAALVARPLLVRDRFVAVNVSPAALLSAEVQTALGSERRLEHIVVELTDHVDGADPASVRAAVDALRAAGGGIAIDEAGAASNSLERVMAVRPHYIKVSGSVVAGVAQDLTRVSVIESLSELATRLDSWLIGKGVETEAQLQTLMRLGVPFAQGYYLGHPAPAMAELAPGIRAIIRQQAMETGTEVAILAGVLDQVMAVEASPQAVADAFVADPQLEYVVCLGGDHKPLGVLDRPAHDRGNSPRPPMILPTSMPLNEAARRAMSRGLATRYDPIVCVADDGLYAGVVQIDRLVLALTRS